MAKMLIPDIRAERAKDPEKFDKMEQQAREACANYPCSECEVKQSCQFERMVAAAKGVKEQKDIPKYMKNLRKIREERKLTQLDIATVLGITQTAYARYERAANELPIKHFIVLCKYYGVSSDEVIGIKTKK